MSSGDCQNIITTNCGIYQISNRLNGKVYVGQSNDLKKRRIVHFSMLRHCRHGNPHLQHAFNLYGEQNFEFSILEIVPEEFLTQREQYWLDLKKAYNPEFGYNISICAEAAARGLKRSLPPFTEEHKRKIALSRIGKPRTLETRLKLSSINRGKKLTEHTKQKIKDTLVTRYKGQPSPLKGISRPGKRSGTMVNCGWCNKVIYRANYQLVKSKSRIFYCTQSCKIKSQKGKNRG